MNAKTKINVRAKVRLLRGLTNILKDDIERIQRDAEDYDIVSLQESVRDASHTLQWLLDNAVELDYELYLHKRNNQEQY